MHALVVTITLAALCAEPPPSVDPVTPLKSAAAAAHERGDYREALTLWVQVYEHDPTPQILNAIGRHHELLGEYQKAYDAYRRVADWANAPTDLRTLDASRAALLLPRLERAWLLPEIPAGVSLWVGASERASGVEVPLPVGDAVVETAQNGWVEVSHIQAPPGARTRVSIISPTDCRGSAIELITGLPILRITVAGYRLRSPVEDVRFLCVAAASQELTIESLGGAPVTITVNGAAGRAVRLVTDYPPPPTGPSTTQYAIGGSGLALALAGATLLALAEAERSSVVGAPRDARGVPVGITLAQAEGSRDQASLFTQVGAVLLGTGAAGLGAALGWWALDGPRQAPDPRVQLDVREVEP